MKVLSLTQPWASLVVTGKKQIETRSWKTKYRGELLIHATSKIPSRRERFYFEHTSYFNLYIRNMLMLPYGAIIGKVLLKDVIPANEIIYREDILKKVNWQQEISFDDFSTGRYAWILQSSEAFQNILPVKGSLGLWDYNGLVH